MRSQRGDDAGGSHAVALSTAGGGGEVGETVAGLALVEEARTGGQLRLTGQLRGAALGADAKERPDAQAGDRDGQSGNHPALAARLADGGGEGEPLELLGFLDGETLLARVAGVAHDLGEHVVRQLHALDAGAVLKAEEPAGDERVDERRRDLGELERGFKGEIVAKAGFREQVILDERAHARWEIVYAALVEIGEDLAAVAGDEVDGDLRLAERAAALVELAADDGQQGGLDVELGQPLNRAAARPGDKFDDLARHLLGHELRAGLDDGLERLGAGHAREPHAVRHHRRHDRFKAFEFRQEILAQGDDHAVIGAAEIERLQFIGRALKARDQLFGGPVFDQFCELAHECDRAVAAGARGGPQREEFLELVEDEHGNDRAPTGVDQPVIAMVK